MCGNNNDFITDRNDISFDIQYTQGYWIYKRNEGKEMIIESQDKKAIHNFNNVLSLQIEPTLKEYSIEVYDAINDGSSLGIYSSEERAKEVLKEIWEFYEISKRYECSSNNGITLFSEPKFAYEMPER